MLAKKQTRLLGWGLTLQFCPGLVLALMSRVIDIPFLPSWKWKITLNERKRILEGPIFDFHNCGRKGSKYPSSENAFQFMLFHQRCLSLPTFHEPTTGHSTGKIRQVFGSPWVSKISRSQGIPLKFGKLWCISPWTQGIGKDVPRSQCGPPSWEIPISPIVRGYLWVIIPKNPIREHNKYHGYTVRGTPVLVPWNIFQRSPCWPECTTYQCFFTSQLIRLIPWN